MLEVDLATVSTDLRLGMVQVVKEGGTSCSQNEEHRIKHKTCIHLKRKEEDSYQKLLEVDLVVDVCAKNISIGIYSMAVKYDPL